MTLYYLFQHVLLALGLALSAICMPKWFHLTALSRALLAASLTPQVIGLLVMALAYSGVHTQMLYKHAPTILGAVMLVIVAIRHPQLCRRFPLRLWLTPASIAMLVIASMLAIQLGFILIDNVGILNVLAHDFNVYLTGATAFAASPGVKSIPSFFGEVGDIIVVHPHSFIFEAYLSHAVMLGGDFSFPPLGFLARVAQQLTLIYLILVIAGVTVAAGGRWALLGSLCLVVYIPWVYYILGALSRDAFRMVPIFGLIVVLSSLGLNFNSALVRRGLLAGAYAAAAVMSHTLGLMLSAITIPCILSYAYILRRPSWRALGVYLMPVVLVAGLSVVRYVQNYLETGGFMGYGLQYSIYEGTWLEPLFGKAWVGKEVGWSLIMHTLLDRYGWYMQVGTIAVSCLAAFVTRGRGRVAYLSLLVAFWAPLLIAVSGLLDYAGINLRSALMTNARYALSFFLLSAPLLAVGIARLGRELARNLSLGSAVRQVAVVVVTCYAAWLAHKSMLTPPWHSEKPNVEDIKQIKFLDRATRCLGPSQHWFINDDRWQPYFLAHPPVFAFTMPARPLLMATDVREVGLILQSMKVKLVVFIEKPERWRDSPLYGFIKEHWVRIQMDGGTFERELWVAPDMSACVGLP